jgi:hypothetical protein
LSASTPARYSAHESSASTARARWHCARAASNWFWRSPISHALGVAVLARVVEIVRLAQRADERGLVLGLDELRAARDAVARAHLRDLRRGRIGIELRGGERVLGPRQRAHATVDRE